MNRDILSEIAYLDPDPPAPVVVSMPYPMYRDFENAAAERDKWKRRAVWRARALACTGMFAIGMAIAWVTR